MTNAWRKISNFRAWRGFRRVGYFHPDYKMATLRKSNMDISTLVGIEIVVGVILWIRWMFNKDVC